MLGTHHKSCEVQKKGFLRPISGGTETNKKQKAIARKSMFLA